jgi:hypothetical protein
VGKALWSTTSACASVPAWQQPCATANPGFTPPTSSTPRYQWYLGMRIGVRYRSVYTWYTL